MRALDPEEDSPSPAGPQDSQSSDQSSGKLRQAWDAWTSRPENNAFLLQTGLSLLQPRAPGQSGVGQFANAIGQGAEASTRNVGEQEAEQKASAEQEFKRREAGAREMTAGAYAEQVRQGGNKANPNAKSGLQTQMAFQRWLSKPEDTTGLTTDPILGAIAKQYPDVKTKADLLANPQARRAAFQLYQSQFAAPAEEGDGEDTGTPAPAATAPAAPAPKIIYDKQGKAYKWDGVQGHPPVPM